MSEETNAFEGLDGITSVDDIRDAGKKLLVALVGKPKTGKSWFAATAPGNVIIYDFDDRHQSLSTLPDHLKNKVQIVKCHDETQSLPTGFQKLESHLSILKYRQSQGLAIPDSYVLDSATYLKEAIENVFFKGGGASRSIKVSPTTSILRGKDWDTINAVVGAFNYLISEFSSLGHLIVVFHERAEKDKTLSTKEITKYTDQVTVDPQYLAVLLSRFNEVFRIDLNYEQDYVVTCKPSNEFRGSTTLLIDKEEKPDLQGLLDKHRAALDKLTNK